MPVGRNILLARFDNASATKVLESIGKVVAAYATLFYTVMETTPRKIGTLGEEYAASFLRSKGYDIVQMNFRVRGGEIDIIARPPAAPAGPAALNTDTLVFVEVKTRSSDAYGHGEEAFRRGKRMNFRRAAREYVIRNFILKNKKEPEIQQDFVEIRLGKSGALREISHFEQV